MYWLYISNPIFLITKVLVLKRNKHYYYYCYVHESWDLCHNYNSECRLCVFVAFICQWLSYESPVPQPWALCHTIIVHCREKVLNLSDRKRWAVLFGWALFIFCSSIYPAVFFKIIWTFLPPSSGVATCAGIAGSVMWHLHLMRPCCVALGWVLIWVVGPEGLWE